MNLKATEVLSVLYILLGLYIGCQFEIEAVKTVVHNFIMSLAVMN